MKTSTPSRCSVIRHLSDAAESNDRVKVRNIWGNFLMVVRAIVPLISELCPGRLSPFHRWRGKGYERFKRVGGLGVSETTILLFLAILIAACGQTTPTPESLAPAAMPKQLATVFISPTPDANEVQSTLGATTATPSVPPPTPSSQPTAYVGVFLGEAQPDEGEPNINPGVFAVDALPTLDAPGAACSIPPDEAFGTTWGTDATVNTKLGCPIENADTFNGTLQIFESGVMYWRPTGEIWAIYPGGGRYWYVASAPPVEPGEISVPDGLRAPVLGFGAVWRGIDGVQTALGFATTDEQELQISLQRFQGGALLSDRSSGQVFVLYSDSTLAGPY